jgi:hypothetical protein
MRKSVLKQEAYIELYNVMNELEERYIRALREDVTGFCVSFDHRNAEKPLSEGQRQSIEKAIKFCGKQRGKPDSEKPSHETTHGSSPAASILHICKHLYIVNS